MSAARTVPPKIRIALLGFSLLVALLKLVDWAAEYLWIDALGYPSVFWMILSLKIGLFVIAFVLVFIYLWTNLRILSSCLDLDAATGALITRFVQRSGSYGASVGWVQPATTRSAGRLPGLVILAASLIALIFGVVLASDWDTFLRFWWSQAYGDADPIYGHDIGFYLFSLPFLELVQNSLLWLTFVASTLVLSAYAYAGILRIGWGQGIEAPSLVYWHAAGNVITLLVALAWGYYLGRFALLQSSSGAVYGAGYTEVHVVRPALWVMVGATLAMAMSLLFPRLCKKRRVALTALGGYLVFSIVSLAIVPWAVQGFVVEPNELEAEKPFLRHNIAFTRKAYGLDQVEERSYRAVSGLDLTDLAQNQQTIENIRLWDWRPLSQTFRQLQRIRAYYEFSDVDVDRYRVDGTYRQVMLSARELSDDLPGKAETWVNRHLQYTHGYGLAMSLTATKDEQGGPVLVIKDLPPRTEAGLPVTQPGIYYGETMSDYRIVTSSVQEFDYPQGDENAYTRYRGHGGIRLDAFWKTLLFAWHQFDVNILLTGYVTPDSRIQLWRGVRERVRRIAPFLRLDADPYPVLSDGRVYWIQDAYTVSSSFPYAEPHENEFNYIRNSVKVVVDAYDGDVTFYVIDPSDPVLAVYRAAFPALFRALDDMPDELQRHLRYPQELFEVQMALYSTYHMTVPQVFYNREDPWTPPWEKYGGEVIRMKPYYVLMKLPEEDRLQFLLMSPLTPSNRDNMIAWVTARCDFPGYGELIVFKLSKDRLILGPLQIEAMIDQDTLISQQLSLWDQRGSRVIRGNLLVIPIEQSFIYVEPVYLIAEGTNIPQLKRIIVSNGERLAMEPTLEQALAAVFGELGRRTLQEPVAQQADRLSEARQAFKLAEEALRDGEWDAFGRAMRAVKEILGQ